MTISGESTLWTIMHAQTHKTICYRAMGEEQLERRVCLAPMVLTKSLNIQTNDHPVIFFRKKKKFFIKMMTETHQKCVKELEEVLLPPAVQGR